MTVPLLRLLPVLALVALLAACAGGDAEAPAAVESTPVTAQMLAEGRESFQMWCANCHGSEGRGDGPDAMMLDPKPRDQTDPETMSALSDLDIAETIVFGGAPRGYPNMPAVPTVSGDELVALVAFVRSLSSDDVESVGVTPDSF